MEKAIAERKVSIDRNAKELSKFLSINIRIYYIVVGNKFQHINRPFISIGDFFSPIFCCSSLEQGRKKQSSKISKKIVHIVMKEFK